MSAWPYPFWFAHRGAGKLAPENTLAAFRTGAAHGFHAFECDVKLSADGVPYLLHDDDLDRTTSGRGPAQSWSWSDLSRLDAGSWMSRLFAGEPVASLDAVAAFCLRNGCALNLEIKPCPGMARETGLAVARWLGVHWPTSALPPLLSSFQPEALAAARDGDAQWPRALLLEQMDPDWRDTARSLGCAAVVAHHPVLSEDVVHRAHQDNLRLLAYTVNDSAVVQRLQAWQVDGVITDAIDRFSATNFTL